MICVFVLNPYIKYISNVESQSKPTGIANIIGNKGGVGIAFNIMETRICFISCHLAARPNNMHLRIHNFYDLMKNIRFGEKKVETSACHDYFFIFGDMNFRVDCKYSSRISFSNNLP